MRIHRAALVAFLALSPLFVVQAYWEKGNSAPPHIAASAGGSAHVVVIQQAEATPVMRPVQATSPTETGDILVYVTRTGTKYHRAGCRYLSRSAIPMPLKEAVARYAPCSVCKPPTLASLSQSPPAERPPTSGREVIPWRDAAKYYGQVKTVEGTIVDTRNTGKVCFLNFSQNWKTDFTAVIFASDFGKFLPNPEAYYKGKKVQVTGKIQEYQGKAEIILNRPDQIKIME